MALHAFQARPACLTVTTKSCDTTYPGLHYGGGVGGAMRLCGVVVGRWAAGAA
jgi:hypothetical protein